MSKDLVAPNIEHTAEEIKAIFVEAEFNSRMVLIEAYHEAGRLILELPGDTTANLKRVSELIGRSDRMLYHAVKFARTYKSVNEIPEGKNISMRKIINNYLTTPKEKAEHTHTPITLCSVCKERLDG